MLAFLWKVFGILFPFLQEIFFGKKIRRGKKKAPDPFYHHPLFKNALIVAGLVSFLAVPYLAFMVYTLREENAKKEEEEKFGAVAQAASAPEKQAIKPVVVALPPPDAIPTPRPVAPPASPKRRLHPVIPRQQNNADNEEHQATLRQLRNIGNGGV